MAVIGATGLEPVNILGAYTQGREVGRANRLARAQEQQLLRETEQQAQLRNFLSSADLDSPEIQNQLLRFGTPGATIAKTLGEMKTAELTRQKTAGDIAKQERDMQRQSLTDALGFLTSAAESPENYPQAYQQALQFMPAEQLAAMGITEQFDEKALSQVANSLLTQEQRLLEEDRKARRRIDLGNLSARQREQRLAEEKFEREGDLDFQDRLERVKAAGKFKGESLAKAQSELPGAVERANEALRVIDQMVGKPQKVDAKGKVVEKGTAPHPGFEGAVGAGLGTRFIPGSDAASFEALYDQVTGGAFLQAYETLRGTGQITEIEGAKATSAITRMRLAQSEKDFVQAAREFQDVIRRGVDRARSKAGAPSAPGAQRTTAGGTAYSIEE
jgi:hypothetical protein